MHPIIQKIQDLITRIQNAIQRLADIINAVLGQVPDFLQWVVDKVTSAWDELMKKIGELWNKLGDFFSFVGDPGAIQAAADSWHDLGVAASTAATTVTGGQLYAEDPGIWSGSTAMAYRGRVGDQQATIAAINDKIATTMSSSLVTLKGAVITLYWMLAGALAALAAGIISGLGSSATILGLPPGVAIIIGAVVVAIVAIGKGYFDFQGAVNTGQTTMLATITDTKVVSWPQFVA